MDNGAYVSLFNVRGSPGPETKWKQAKRKRNVKEKIPRFLFVFEVIFEFVLFVYPLSVGGDQERRKEVLAETQAGKCSLRYSFPPQLILISGFRSRFLRWLASHLRYNNLLNVLQGLGRFVSSVFFLPLRRRDGLANPRNRPRPFPRSHPGG